VMGRAVARADRDWEMHRCWGRGRTLFVELARRERGARSARRQSDSTADLDMVVVVVVQARGGLA